MLDKIRRDRQATLQRNTRARSPDVRPMELDSPETSPDRSRTTLERPPLESQATSSTLAKLLPQQQRATPAIEAPDPIKCTVDEMREQRMSMVANFSQYQFCYEAVLIGCLRDLAREASSAPSAGTGNDRDAAATPTLSAPALRAPS